MRNPVLWWVLVVLIGAAGAAFYFWRHNQAPEPQVQAPAPTTQPSPKPDVEPPVRYPVGEAQSPLPQPLAPLNESDPTMVEALAGVFGRQSFDQFFVANDIVRHIVATVDNLPRKKVALRLVPLKPTRGGFVTSRQGESVVISAENYPRYAPYIRLAQDIDTPKLVSVYVHLYPLFQQAYQELGYPSGYFNDRVVEAIDNLLATPDIKEPIELVQPKVFYEFADPNLEALSAGQKILLRMGSDNAHVIKAKLRELRQALTREPGKRDIGR